MRLDCGDVMAGKEQNARIVPAAVALSGTVQGSKSGKEGEQGGGGGAQEARRTNKGEKSEERNEEMKAAASSPVLSRSRRSRNV